MADFLAARKVPISGPFEPMLYSPQVMSRARAMGDYLRYSSGIGNTLSEFAILIVARTWSAAEEWSGHAPIAAKAGIDPAIIEAIRNGRRPDAMTADETIVYDLLTELQQTRHVSDATFDRAATRFGKLAVVDLVGICGYYTFIAMQLSIANYQPADGTALPLLPN